MLLCVIPLVKEVTHGEVILIRQCSASIAVIILGQNMMYTNVIKENYQCTIIQQTTVPVYKYHLHKTFGAPFTDRE